MHAGIQRNRILTRALSFMIRFVFDQDAKSTSMRIQIYFNLMNNTNTNVVNVFSKRNLIATKRLNAFGNYEITSISS